MRPLRPICIFLCVFLPGGALALSLGVLAERSAPGLALLVFLSLGFLAFIVGVSAAARAPIGRATPGQRGRVLAVLDLRRNRARYAMIFSALAVGAIALAYVMSGPAQPVGQSMGQSTGHALLALIILFVTAWLVIGEAACSQAAIRRALLRESRRA